jgi:endonuclease YncB( thermonuclease family)
MRQFTMSVVALTAFGVMLTAAQADILNGAPDKNGNQCFTYSQSQGRDARFGIWGACPQKASAAVAPRQVRKHRSSR